MTRLRGAVKCLRNYRSGGPSSILAEHLKGWLVDAMKKEKEEVKGGRR